MPKKGTPRSKINSPYTNHGRKSKNSATVTTPTEHCSGLQSSPTRIEPLGMEKGVTVLLGQFKSDEKELMRQADADSYSDQEEEEGELASGMKTSVQNFKKEKAEKKLIKKIEKIESEDDEYGRCAVDKLIMQSLGRLFSAAKRELKIPAKQLFAGTCCESMYIDHEDVDRFSPYEAFECEDAFVAMSVSAFNNHKPIALTPDLIYSYIAKGFAIHINKFSKELRNVFVSHEGKQKLIVRRDDFLMGSASNPWNEVFDAFGKQLLGKTKPFLEDIQFSTSTSTTHAHRSVLMMESMQEFFEFVFVTRCGIPSITLLGEKLDWVKLRETVNCHFETLSPQKGFALDWWKEKLMPVLDNFISTFDNQSNAINDELVQWMQKIVKYKGPGDSGKEARISGWINSFFPYIKHENGTQGKNMWFDKSDGHENELKTFGSYLASVPFVWDYMGQNLDMHAFIGYCCVTQQKLESASAAPVNTLHCNPGWLIIKKCLAEHMCQETVSKAYNCKSCLII